MIYWIEDMRDGSVIACANNYQTALLYQDEIWRHHKLDTYIRKG